MPRARELQDRGLPASSAPARRDTARSIASHCSVVRSANRTTGAQEVLRFWRRDSNPRSVGRPRCRAGHRLDERPEELLLGAAIAMWLSAVAKNWNGTTLGWADRPGVRSRSRSRDTRSPVAEHCSAESYRFLSTSRPSRSAERRRRHHQARTPSPTDVVGQRQAALGGGSPATRSGPPTRSPG